MSEVSDVNQAAVNLIMKNRSQQNRLDTLALDEKGKKIAADTKLAVKTAEGNL